ncbi:MAG: DedA family protein [Actinomycetota bacterium]|nr:DedA family protein [Actinomycetota bacterium]
MQWLTDAVSGSPVSYLVVALASAADVLLPVVPSETIVITSGVVAAQGGLLIWLVVPLAAIGALVGDNVAYLLGAKLGHPVARRLLRGERARARLAWAERALRRHGVLVVVVGRFIPGGRTASTFAAGTLHMAWRRFIVADLAAAWLWAAYAAMLGYLGGAAFRDSSWKPLLTSLGLAAIIGAAIDAWRRVQRRRGRDILGDPAT